MKIVKAIQLIGNAEVSLPGSRESQFELNQFRLGAALKAATAPKPDGLSIREDLERNRNGGASMKHRPSSLPALAQCPKFESGGSSEFEEAGTVRHHALSVMLLGNEDSSFTSDDLDLDDEQMDGVKWAEEYIRLHAPTTDHPLICERKREWTGPDFSDREGTPDVTCGNHIFDLKWRKRDYDSQMADYALAIMEEGGFESVTVHILYGAFKQVEVIQFDLASASRIVLDILTKANDTKSEPIPCDYCGWCSKRLTCSALLERANAVAEHREDWGLASYHGSEILTAEEMGKALRLAKALGKWCESVEHHARELARNGIIAEGFKVQERKGNRFIASIMDAYSRAGIEQSDFLSACEIKFSSLVELHAAKEGIKKAAAEREMERRLGEVVQRKQSTVSLVSIKDKE